MTGDRTDDRRPDEQPRTGPGGASPAVGRDHDRAETGDPLPDGGSERRDDARREDESRTRQAGGLYEQTPGDGQAVHGSTSQHGERVDGAPRRRQDTRSGTEQWADQPFTKRYGTPFVVILAGLIVTNWVPFVNFVTFFPTFKEILIAAVVVAGFTTVSDATTGAKVALVSGMAAAVVFNLINIPMTMLFSGVVGGLLGGSTGSAVAEGVVGGFGAFVNLIGVVFFSPIGYVIGGLVGGAIND